MQVSFARLAGQCPATLLREADTRLTATPDVVPSVSDQSRLSREKQAFSLAQVNKDREFLSTNAKSMTRNDLGRIRGEKGPISLST